jgi:hypothetical protein
MAWVVECFKSVDKDMSGKLSIDEFNQVFSVMAASGYNVGHFSDCIAEIDKSGDGEINFNEFVGWVKNSKSDTPTLFVTLVDLRRYHLTISFFLLNSGSP